VARVGGVELREADLERLVARDPGASPRRVKDPVQRKELIDGLVRFELLARAAEQAGLLRDPDAIYAQRQIAVTKLVNQALGAVASPDAIPREDVEREYLTRRASEFTLAPAAHVRHVRLAEPERAAQLAERARALAPEDDAGFIALVAENSDDPATSAAGGDLGFVDRTSRLAPALVEAALSLGEPGQVAGPLEVGSGYEIVRLVNRRAAAVSPLAAVEGTIRQRLYRERRAKALDELVKKLENETKVELVPP
jgi:parvulin-like peptidyl-prolyl isomerase